MARIILLILVVINLGGCLRERQPAFAWDQTGALQSYREQPVMVQVRLGAGMKDQLGVLLAQRFLTFLKKNQFDVRAEELPASADRAQTFKRFVVTLTFFTKEPRLVRGSSGQPENMDVLSASLHLELIDPVSHRIEWASNVDGSLAVEAGRGDKDESIVRCFDAILSSAPRAQAGP